MTHTLQEQLNKMKSLTSKLLNEQELIPISPRSDMVRMLLKSNPHMNDDQFDAYLASLGYVISSGVEAVAEPETKKVYTTPSIKDVSDKLFTQKRDYGMFWLVNKLVSKNIKGHTDINHHTYNTWVNGVDRNFIMPKIHHWKDIGYGNKRETLTIEGIGMFAFEYYKGNNGNLSITLTFTQY